MSGDKQRALAVVILTAVIGFAVMAVGIFVWKELTRPNIGEDNCLYEDRGLRRRADADQTIVVVDQSEELSASHKRQVKELLVELLADDKLLPERSVVFLYVFGKNDFQGKSGQDLAPMVRLCRPPSSGNEVYENKRKLERTFRDRFVSPLYQAIDQSLGVALGERSPILEMLQYLSRTQDIKESVGKKFSKRLVLVSDLLQHSETLSHYKGDTYEDFLRSELKANMSGWTVRVLYLQRYGRDQRLQSKLLDNFWLRYFHETGAKVERMERIP